ncbi:hypothetical protein, partial [Mesorhizobium sp.]|uniref:hypothetical protein n=1 Tax=Mesorhizobium sp. TaxID=1871066 RepID=UPI0025BDC8A8
RAHIGISDAKRKRNVPIKGKRNVPSRDGATAGKVKIRARLTVGTSLERIGDESLTHSDSGFVHGYMWIFWP